MIYCELSKSIFKYLRGCARRYARGYANVRFGKKVRYNADVGSESKKSIIKTILYSDLFDFPLTEDEIHRFLISSRPVEKKAVVQELKKLNKDIEEKDGYWFLKSRQKSVQLRKEREQHAKKKLARAGAIARILSIIPTIQLIGVSGGLSMYNAKVNDDIDFFIITKASALWSTRLCSILLLKIMGLLRTKSDTHVDNKACLNMFIDETVLTFSLERQDMYTAHEIVQMLPLYERNETYNQFISKNKWIEKFLANAFYRRTKPNRIQNNAEEKVSVVPRSNPRSFAFEVLAKKVQLYYMKQHKTTEEVSDHFLAFHPNDYRQSVLHQFSQQLKKYEQI